MPKKYNKKSFDESNEISDEESSSSITDESGDENESKTSQLLNKKLLEFDKKLQKRFNIYETNFNRMLKAKLDNFEATKKREMEALRVQKENVDKELILLQNERELISKLRIELEDQKRMDQTSVVQPVTPEDTPIRSSIFLNNDKKCPKTKHLEPKKSEKFVKESKNVEKPSTSAISFQPVHVGFKAKLTPIHRSTAGSPFLQNKIETIIELEAVDAINTHLIYKLPRQRIFILLQELTKPIVTIIEENIKYLHNLSEELKKSIEYISQIKNREESIYPNCVECGKNCTAANFSYEFCDVCTHHISMHHYIYSETAKDQIRNLVEKNLTIMEERKKELDALEAQQEVIQEACVQFSLYGSINGRTFSTAFIDYILDATKKAQLEMNEDVSITLKSFADIFNERLENAKNKGFDQFVTRKSVTEQILHLVGQERSGNKLLEIVNEEIDSNNKEE